MKIPDYINHLTAYKPGKPIEETQREYGLKQVFKLASNENPLGPSPLIRKALEKAIANQHLYPDPSQYELLQAGTKFWNLKTENISFGNGTDEIIDFLVRIFCRTKDQILFPLYSFQAYEVTAGACQVECVRVPLKDQWHFDLDKTIEAFEKNKEKIKIVFIANPNNPTGTYMDAKTVRSFLDYFRKQKDVLIVFDEAYFEFTRAQDYESAVQYLPSTENLVVLRTFSKIFGIAGLRLGAMLANAPIVQAYNKMRKPFNVSGLAQVAGVAAMADQDFIRQTQQITWSGLDYYYGELTRLKIDYIPSEGNFVLIDTQTEASVVFEQLLRRGIILRPVKNYGLPNHLRMSVGLEIENQAAIKALAEVLRG
ncbi:MAG: histidinol-phosphate transaminase [Bdellovibrionaceae bacterium]|nr:histidinol-phosphate transaminase [Pseudobdellovibrionaceae bacterium]